MQNDIKLEILSENYGLENPIIINKLGGMSSENYHISDVNTEYVLKFIKTEMKKNLQCFIGIPKYLRDRKLPVAIPICTLLGNEYVEKEGNIFILYTKIQGICFHESDFNDKALQSTGKLLANLHLKGKNFKVNIPYQPYDFSFNHILENISSFRKRILTSNLNSQYFKIIMQSIEVRRKMINALSKEWLSQETNDYTFIHGDFHNENLLFDSTNEVVGMIDFEESCYGNVLTDIMHFILLACCNTGFSSKNLENAKIFAKKYMSLYPVSSDNIRKGLKKYLIEFSNSLFFETKLYNYQDPLFVSFIQRDIKIVQYFNESLDDFIHTVFYGTVANKKLG